MNSESKTPLIVVQCAESIANAYSQVFAVHGVSYDPGKSKDIICEWICKCVDKELAAAQEQSERLRRALESIRQLGLGPDKGSSGWQAESANTLAKEALSATTAPRMVSREVLDNVNHELEMILSALNGEGWSESELRVLIKSRATDATKAAHSELDRTREAK